MGSSIRWTLLGWTGLLLSSVLAAFCLALHGSAKEATLGGVDADLIHRAEIIAAALEWDDEDLQWEFEISADYIHGLAADGNFFVWAPDEKPMVVPGIDGPTHGPTPLGWVTEGEVRAYTIEGPLGTRIQVSRSIAVELARLHELFLTVLAVGAGVLVLGLGGGWLLARRVLAPVASLTRDAASITAPNLERRLDVESAPQELRELAAAFNAALDRAEEALSQEKRFTQDASHELRTPLAVLRTQVEVALRGAQDTEELRAALVVSLRAAERMTGLVEGLLSLARADGNASGAVDSRERVALGDLVREAADLLGVKASEREVTLSYNVEPASVVGDPRLLYDAVANLVENGVRYNQPGGTVDIALRLQGHEAVLCVSDSGVGIPAEARPHVFDRFYRVDPARSRSEGGAGLGLAITRWIVEAHHGSIEIQDRQGGGTTFEVRLPVVAA